jgi:hypothetical protein
MGHPIPLLEQNVNRSLLQAGLARERDTDFSPMGVKTRFSALEQVFGRYAERIAHLNIPALHRKFNDVGTPLELYERDLLFGSTASDWNTPYQSFIKPTAHWAISRDPLTAGALGAFFGWNVMRGAARKYGAYGGAILGAGLALAREGEEWLSGKPWIPKRRLEAWELQEYFDTLQYVKSMRLFNVYRQAAIEHEGGDPQELLNTGKLGGEDRKLKIKKLQEEKRRLMHASPTKNAAKIAKITQQINEEQAVQTLYSIGPLAARSILYHQQAQRTAYGVQDSPGDWQASFAAMPPNLRELFGPMSEAPQKDKDRFYSLLPDYLKRVVGPSWREKDLLLGARPDLPTYFQSHWLPSEQWAGFDPRFSLKDVLAKEIDMEGLNPIEMGFYPEEMENARRSRIQIPGVHRVNFHGSQSAIRKGLERILSGVGLSDVKVDMTTEYVSNLGRDQISVDTSLERDETQQILDGPDLTTAQ